MMKKAYLLFTIVILVISACKKEKSEPIKAETPKVYTYYEALSVLGIEKDAIYGYGNAMSSQPGSTGTIRFHSEDIKVTEKSNMSGDSLTYYLNYTIVQPTAVGMLPKIKFYPYDAAQHSQWTNSQKYQNLSFLRYSSDSAIIEKLPFQLIFRCLGKTTYQGNQELRKF